MTAVGRTPTGHGAETDLRRANYRFDPLRGAQSREACRSGLRVDGRRPNELRRLRAHLGVLRAADGSAYLEMGNTKVVAAVYGPREVRRGRAAAAHDRAIVTCEFSMATFSTGERRRRSKGDKCVAAASEHAVSGRAAADVDPTGGRWGGAVRLTAGTTAR